jgi:hypothetical protein
MEVVYFLLGNSPASEFYVPTVWNILPPMKMEQTECSKTSAYRIQTPGNYPEERIQHSEHGKSLKSRIIKENDELKPGSLQNYVLCDKCDRITSLKMKSFKIQH